VPRIVEVREGILKKNDLLAGNLRARFNDSGVFVASLVSSPGAGKTTLLQKTLYELKDSCRVGALVGDLATDRDAQRLAETGARVRQITTGTVCHLDAQMVEQALDDWDLTSLDLLFIENVGNLVCPAEFDLGANLAVVVASAPEGHDKPYKYPGMFAAADVVLLNKADVAPVFDFDLDFFRRGVQMVNPNAPVFVISCKTGIGMDDWVAWLAARCKVES
jgi:hydrogenase nickel incorporation protein HypB